ncbi:MAG: cell division protein FtsZ [Pseudomonadota bacterium]
MSIKLEPPKLTELRPRIVVIGVGGAGGNAINNMIASGLTGVEYVAANTDAQALAASSAERRLQLGQTITEGLGAGARPEIGHAAAEETLDEIRSEFAGAHMAFVAAGMGGGTGTGAASVIAREVKQLGCLTVAIVSKPFHFEGTRRMRTAEAGIEELRKHVDTLIVVPNQNLFRIANDRTTFAEAFVLADQILYSGIAGIVDLILKDGLINLDFADVRTIMTEMGNAVMGTGEAEGPQRATLAAEQAIANPLLDDITLFDAKGVLISIVGGPDMTLFEVDEAVSRIRQEIDSEANIIIGAAFDTTIEDRIRIAILASGMDGAVTNPGDASGGSQSEDVASSPGVNQADTSSELPPLLPASALFGMGPAASAEEVAPPPPDKAQPPTEAPAAPAANSRGQSAQPVWTSADGVVVEALPPRLDSAGSADGNAGYVGPEPDKSAVSDQAATFQPAATSGPRRPPQRMPSVEDFAPHAQKEYFAKGGSGPRDVATGPRHVSTAPGANPVGADRQSESVRKEQQDHPAADRAQASASAAGQASRG